MCLASYIRTLSRGHGHPPKGHVFPRSLEIHIRIIIIPQGQGNRCTYFYFLSRGINIVNWITMTRKSGEHLHTIYRNTVSTFLGLISSVYRNIYHWRSNQQPQIGVLKLYNWATSSYRTQVIPNQLVMVIARLNNLKKTRSTTSIILKKLDSLVLWHINHCRSGGARGVMPNVVYTYILDTWFVNIN